MGKRAILTVCRPGWRARGFPSFHHVTVGSGWPQGGLHSRVTCSPTVATASRGWIWKSSQRTAKRMERPQGAVSSPPHPRGARSMSLITPAPFYSTRLFTDLCPLFRAPPPGLSSKFTPDPALPSHPPAPASPRRYPLKPPSPQASHPRCPTLRLPSQASPATDSRAPRLTAVPSRLLASQV